MANARIHNPAGSGVEQRSRQSLWNRIASRNRIGLEAPFPLLIIEEMKLARKISQIILVIEAQPLTDPRIP